MSETGYVQYSYQVPTGETVHPTCFTLRPQLGIGILVIRPALSTGRYTDAAPTYVYAIVFCELAGLGGRLSPRHGKSTSYLHVVPAIDYSLSSRAS